MGTMTQFVDLYENRCTPMFARVITKIKKHFAKVTFTWHFQPEVSCKGDLYSAFAESLWPIPMPLNNQRSHFFAVNATNVIRYVCSRSLLFVCIALTSSGPYFMLIKSEMH